MHGLERHQKDKNSELKEARRSIMIIYLFSNILSIHRVISVVFSDLWGKLPR